MSSVRGAVRTLRYEEIGRGGSSAFAKATADGSDPPWDGLKAVPYIR